VEVDPDTVCNKAGHVLDDDHEISQCLNAYAVEARTQDFVQKTSAYAPRLRKGHIRHGIGLNATTTVCGRFTRHGTSFRDTTLEPPGHTQI
jgi:hypothetical protein